jgi:hypothetical protein
MSGQSFWWNYATEDYEENGEPVTDDKALQYLPQIPAAQGLYECHRKLGKSILEAMMETLLSVVGRGRE